MASDVTETAPADNNQPVDDVTAPSETPMPPIVPTEPIGIASNFAKWDAVVSVDASLYTNPVPNLRLPNEPVRPYPIILAETLIGRRSDLRNIHPEINVNDPGVSHRHVRILRGADDSLSLEDAHSTNGTWLNDVEVAAGHRVPLADGDQITIGNWTRVAIRVRRT